MAPAGEHDDIPTLPYATTGPAVTYGWLHAIGHAGVAWSFVSLLAAYAYGKVYVTNVGSWCGTPVASAGGVLFIVAVPGLLLTIGGFLTAGITGQRGGRRRLLVAMLAHLTSCLTPFLWELRADWW